MKSTIAIPAALAASSQTVSPELFNASVTCLRGIDHLTRVSGKSVGIGMVRFRQATVKTKNGKHMRGFNLGKLAKPAIDHLISLGLLECDNKARWGHKFEAKTYCYTLLPVDEYELIEFDADMLPTISRDRDAHRKKLNDVSKSFTFDYKAAHSDLISRPHGWDDHTRAHSARISNDFSMGVDYRAYTIRDKSGNRYHSPYTNQPKKLDKYLVMKTRGRGANRSDLVTIDIANAQPLFLLAAVPYLLDEQGKFRPFGKHGKYDPRIELVHRIRERDLTADTESLTGYADLLAAAQEGRFYERMGAVLKPEHMDGDQFKSDEYRTEMKQAILEELYSRTNRVKSPFRELIEAKYPWLAYVLKEARKLKTPNGARQDFTKSSKERHGKTLSLMMQHVESHAIIDHGIQWLMSHTECKCLTRHDSITTTPEQADNAAEALRCGLYFLGVNGNLQVTQTSNGSSISRVAA
jgi:hypothetical protein